MNEYWTQIQKKWVLNDRRVFLFVKWDVKIGNWNEFENSVKFDRFPQLPLANWILFWQKLRKQHFFIDTLSWRSMYTIFPVYSTHCIISSDTSQPYIIDSNVSTVPHMNIVAPLHGCNVYDRNIARLAGEILTRK